MRRNKRLMDRVVQQTSPNTAAQQGTENQATKNKQPKTKTKPQVAKSCVLI